ncbi:hypothetical protein PGT21_033994 [Puccinia graminis f. sp. tritici]|uniref:Uncharacterized protein n=1 Tax=Puccinia graminis f. sp. tritici TaxID=56615 RepID=A0A5B0NE38_PUCGR|nr:hypothetical protein PGT21_033994 [Puccinia graminis f. sp. tritici]
MKCFTISLVMFGNVPLSASSAIKISNIEKPEPQVKNIPILEPDKDNDRSCPQCGQSTVPDGAYDQTDCKCDICQ